MNIDFDSYSFLGIIIMVSILGAFIINYFFMDYPKGFSGYCDDAYYTIEAMDRINGTYIILPSEQSCFYNRAIYSYGAIYMNLTTSSGWSTHEVSKEYWDKLQKVGNGFNNRDCNLMLEGIEQTNTTELIAYNKGCDFLKECGMIEKHFNQDVCLYVLGDKKNLGVIE